MKNINKEIIAIYAETGVTLDTDVAGGANAFFSKTLLDAFRENPDRALFFFGFEEHTNLSPSLAFVHGIARKFIQSLSKSADIEFTRAAAPLESDELLELLHSVPYALGVEHVSINWIKRFWQGLSEAFGAEIEGYEGTVEGFLRANNETINTVGRVFFHLVESKSEEYPFAFLATYSTGDAKEKRAVHLPLKNALLEYKGQRELLLKLLSTVSKAADASEFISELVESGELFSPLQFTADEAYTFLKEIPLYEASGILCRVPDWWKRKTNALKLSLSMGDDAPSMVGMDALLRFKPSLSLGGETITKEEIEALLSQVSGLSYLKGRWVEVDPEKLKAILEAYEKASALGDVTLAEAMRMQLGIADAPLADKDLGLEIRNGAWLEQVRESLQGSVQPQNLEAGDAFKATLRQYQQAGFNWLGAMKRLGFGALLADDMGLGKTVQILALLEHLRRNGEYKALLILPASLIGNWQKEIEKFTPELSYKVVHGKDASLDIGGAMVCITTYGMAVRLEGLREQNWDVVILDEAQAIKNPGTKQTKAVKQIKAPFKIAMTGTPVENRLSDLWSLFDFLNAGLLGTAKEFSAFAKGMRENDSYAKLRGMISPFILRRLKTDKAIISDLPDKVEMKAYASLTKKQVALYHGLVKELEYRLSTAEGIERKGIVLGAIIKFKQICNHPDQYLGQSGFDEGQSGKFSKLSEICETIREKRERLLVFTQFREMTGPIADYLETLFGRKGLVLHGGTQVKKRTELVDAFNGEDYIPFMVLSLKAGGVGLNLTSANHVVHFDRWWNPAVENQATDRAFRIGQKKNVLVHKFITVGTIEEKIDAMIEEKQKMAGELIAGSGENWITELSNDELMRLCALS